MTTVWDAYIEFTSADPATQSELWDKSIKALQKNPPQNLRLREKEGTVQTMSTRFEQPEATYDELYEAKRALLFALGIDPADPHHNVKSILVESGGFTLTTEDGKRYKLPTVNLKVEDWKAL